MAIHFHHLVHSGLKDRAALKAFIDSLFKTNNAAAGDIHFIFCDDEYLLNINRQSLNHDYYTDIITFELSPRGSKIKDAEIYISVDRVRDNAATFSTTFKRELHRVIFHGILHLCGFKDKTKKAEQEMRCQEELALEKYFG